MAKHLVLSLIVAVVLAQFAESKPAYQYLEAKPGYIPVFIRFGDQPLEDINPMLAEAFGEHGREHGISARNIRPEHEAIPDSPYINLDLSSLMPKQKTVKDSGLSASENAKNESVSESLEEPEQIKNSTDEK